jgi:hypothetical protein
MAQWIRRALSVMASRTAAGNGTAARPGRSESGLVAGAASLLLLLLPLPGCGDPRPPGQAPCRDGGNRCAAARAPAGLREVRHGHRIVEAHWVDRPNRESGLPDIGIRARWAPLIERR